jgi:hypothetical protein
MFAERTALTTGAGDPHGTNLVCEGLNLVCAGTNLVDIATHYAWLRRRNRFGGRSLGGVPGVDVGEERPELRPDSRLCSR